MRCARFIGSKSLASKSFVLVHGAWQGAWAWSDEATALRARGATVTVVELPGHGDAMTPVPGDMLETYEPRRPPR